MRKRYTISLIFILGLIVSLFYIHFNYQTFQNQKSSFEVLTLMSNDLSVNFMNGNPIFVREEEQVVEFSVTNYSEKKLFYSLGISNLLGQTQDVTYTFLREQSENIVGNVEEGIILNRHEILSGVTERYQMFIHNPSKREFTFEIKIETESMNHEFQNVILSREVKDSGDLDYSLKEEDGLFKKSEQQGDLFFYRGNVTDNYFWFANHMWRIVKINEDGTVKLILNDTTESMVDMYSGTEGFHSFFDTSVYNSLDEWYKTNLLDFDEYIVSTKYCFDNGVLSEENGNYTYLASSRLFVDTLPTTVCNGTSITSKIALLTADELMMSGATINENKDFFFYDSDLQSGWWTMTPMKMENGKTYFITMNKDGSLQKETIEDSKLFLKPVITLNRKVKVVGEGSKENPYQIEK